MRILLDASTGRMGGARTYLEEFVNTLTQSSAQDTWIIYGPPGWTAPRSPKAGTTCFELRESPRHCSHPAGYFGWLQSHLPRIARRDRVDVLFSATGFGTFFSPCPQLLLIRNPIYFSELYLSRIRNLSWRIEVSARRWLSLRMIQKSHGVLFPTNAMRDLVAHHVPLQADRSWVVPYGCDAESFRRPAPDRTWMPARIRQAQEPFLLNVSHYCAQKNLTILFKALAILRRKGSSPTLVLTSRLAPGPNCNFLEDQALLRKAQLQADVLQLGPVPRQRLPSLYQAAGAFLFPSYAESFGHPLVEAMASGVPILAADMPVHREICGDAAWYADPFDADDWAEKITRILTDGAGREKLVRVGRSRSEDFSWGLHVDTVSARCRELIRGGPG